MPEHAKVTGLLGWLVLNGCAGTYQRLFLMIISFNVCGSITFPVRVLPHCLPCTQTSQQYRERKTARTLQMSCLKLRAKKAWKWRRQVTLFSYMDLNR